MINTRLCALKLHETGTDKTVEKGKILVSWSQSQGDHVLLIGIILTPLRISSCGFNEKIL